MLWKGRRQSDNVEDQRGQGGGFNLPRGGPGRFRIPVGGRSGGGMSLSTIIILVVLYFGLKAFGIDPLQILAGGDGGVGPGGGQITDNSGE
ncbi:MAG: flagellar biosynthesis protein FlgM, partial [Mesorhizobium sp.]